ncbi:hypothetical protein BDV09DRAFT_172495 [Aspergillus tetrazonus]
MCQCASVDHDIFAILSTITPKLRHELRCGFRSKEISSFQTPYRVYIYCTFLAAFLLDTYLAMYVIVTQVF